MKKGDSQRINSVNQTMKGLSTCLKTSLLLIIMRNNSLHKNQ